ncbi:hypothetical protein CYMTET_3668 [Cymbomonas tetramitiformis]|uniref:Uncharacterized protein n=1 Tax=Cymbomonas tetramitiformis TaxID=36881 RepID=A0AAE0LLA1_9CHLO|nr:hypothetical protein CYMTET_3668 [Cymbomonas tetramitiformis]
MSDTQVHAGSGPVEEQWSQWCSGVAPRESSGGLLGRVRGRGAELEYNDLNYLTDCTTEVSCITPPPPAPEEEELPSNAGDSAKKQSRPTVRLGEVVGSFASRPWCKLFVLVTLILFGLVTSVAGVFHLSSETGTAKLAVCVVGHVRTLAISAPTLQEAVSALSFDADYFVHLEKETLENSKDMSFFGESPIPKPSTGRVITVPNGMMGCANSPCMNDHAALLSRKVAPVYFKGTEDYLNCVGHMTAWYYDQLNDYGVTFALKMQEEHVRIVPKPWFYALYRPPPVGPECSRMVRHPGSPRRFYKKEHCLTCCDALADRKLYVAIGPNNISSNYDGCRLSCDTGHYPAEES